VVAFVSLAACADFILADQVSGPPYIALAFGIVLAVARGARVWAWASVGTAWISTVVIGLLLGADWHPARIAVTTLGILIVFGVGEAVRSRRENFEKYRSALAQRRQTEVQAERVRIARELHDVLAHSLSQINVQASVGLHLADSQPAKAKDALASIKETSKTARFSGSCARRAARTRPRPSCRNPTSRAWRGSPRPSRRRGSRSRWTIR